MNLPPLTSNALDDILAQAGSLIQTSLAEGNPEIFVQQVVSSLSVIQLVSTAVPSDPDEAAALNEQATHVRAQYMDLTQSLLASDPNNVALSAQVVDLVSTICEDPAQISPAVRQQAASVLASSLANLAEAGLLSLALSESALLTISNVLAFLTPVETLVDMGLLFDLMATALGQGLKPGQDPIVLETELVSVVIQAFSSAEGVAVSQGGASFLLSSAGASASAGDGPVTASFWLSKLNVLGGEVDSPLVALSLFASETGQAVSVRDAEVELEVPFDPAALSPGDEPTCQYYNETEQGWSTDGCTVRGIRGSTLLCVCTHLTTFSGRFLPPVVIPEFDKLTWENIQRAPNGLIFLVTMLGVFIVLDVLARCHDSAIDQRTISLLYKALSTGTEAPKEVQAYDVGRRCECHYGPFHHTWAALFVRNPCSSISCSDRVWILYCSLVTGATLTAVFIEASNISLWYDILVVVYCTAVSSGVAFLLTKVTLHCLICGWCALAIVCAYVFACVG